MLNSPSWSWLLYLKWLTWHKHDIHICAKIWSGENDTFTVQSDLTNVKRPYWWLNLVVESEKKHVIWKTTLRSIINAETWLFNIFFKTTVFSKMVNDSKIGFSKTGFVFKLFQFLHIHQFKVDWNSTDINICKNWNHLNIKNEKNSFPKDQFYHYFPFSICQIAKAFSIYNNSEHSFSNNIILWFCSKI